MDVRKTIETKTWHAAVSSPLLRVFEQGADRVAVFDASHLRGIVHSAVDVASFRRTEL